MRRLKWSEADEKRLVDAWNAGVSAEDCAARFGSSRGAVNEKIRQLREAGVRLRWARVRREATHV